MVDRRILGWAAVALTVAFAAAAAAVYGLAPHPSPSAPDAKAATGSELLVSYVTETGDKVSRRMSLDGADCSFIGSMVSVRAASPQFHDAFRAVGTEDAFSGLSLKFDDRAFVATQFATMHGSTLHLDELEGQINQWTGDQPGSVISAEASLSGTVRCATIDRG